MVSDVRERAESLNGSLERAMGADSRGLGADVAALEGGSV